MSQSPTADSFTANQMAKSIIISRSGERPSFLNWDKFKSVPYPTPAMLTYDRVVSHNFSKFYWSQEPRKRLVLCVAVCRELFHEGRGRIYRRDSTRSDILVPVSMEEFRTIVQKRLLNLRYTSRTSDDNLNFTYEFENFSQGEKVMVESPSSLTYQGIFQFHSVINSDYCYIKFDSRNHILRWKTSLVKSINLFSEDNRRITRQMTREMSNTPDDIVGNGVTSTQNTMNRVQSDNHTEELPGGYGYDNLIRLFGYGDENKSVLDEAWLNSQGIVKNSKSDSNCAICLETIKINEVFSTLNAMVY